MSRLDVDAALLAAHTDSSVGQAGKFDAAAGTGVEHRLLDPVDDARVAGHVDAHAGQRLLPVVEDEDARGPTGRLVDHRIRDPAFADVARAVDSERGAAAGR